MSRKPRTALTGVPSGAVNESGTPKNARKYSEAESSRSSLRVEATRASCQASGGAPAWRRSGFVVPM